jgi:hypothetical protein
MPTTTACEQLLQGLAAEVAANTQDVLFGPCGGLTPLQCYDKMAREDGSLWRQSVRARMKEIAVAAGPGGDALTKSLAACLAVGVDALTAKKHGVAYWLQIFDKDRPDAGAMVIPSLPRPLMRAAVTDTSRQPLPLDSERLRCDVQGGLWNPSTGKCMARRPHEGEEDVVGGEVAMEGECLAAGGSWDPTAQMCIMPKAPETLAVEDETKLYLILGGVGAAVLVAGGIYLAVRK